MCTVGEDHYLRLISKHDQGAICTICQEEENKSGPSPRFQGTTILDRIILPKKECWICKLNFKNNNEQVEHFVANHESKSSGNSLRDAGRKVIHKENAIKYLKSKSSF